MFQSRWFKPSWWLYLWYTIAGNIMVMVTQLEGTIARLQLPGAVWPPHELLISHDSFVRGSAVIITFSVNLSQQCC